MVERQAVTRSLAAIPLLLIAAIVALVIFAAVTGPYDASLTQLQSSIGRYLSGAPASTPLDTVLFSVRLPRIFAALITGAALAAAGAVYQGLFRNPLVSPDILGVSAGAGLGAAFGIFLSLPVIAIQGFAFAAGLGTVALVYMVASAVRGHGTGAGAGAGRRG